MKRLLLIVSLVLVMALPSAASAQEGKVVTLKMADSFPIGHPGHKLALGYINSLKKMSKGAIEIEYYPAEQLGKMKDLLKLCQGGVADIAYIAPFLLLRHAAAQHGHGPAVLDHVHGRHQHLRGPDEGVRGATSGTR